MMTTQRLSPDDRRVGVHVALAPNEHANLKALAARLGCSGSEVVRRGIALVAAQMDPSA